MTTSQDSGKVLTRPIGAAAHGVVAHRPDRKPLHHGEHAHRQRRQPAPGCSMRMAANTRAWICDFSSDVKSSVM
jgi:hypothetical protein